MKTPTTVAVLAVAASVAAGQVGLIDLLPGYTNGSVGGMSVDGSVLAIDMVNPDSWGSDGFLFGDGRWSALPRYGLHNRTMGLSADGSAAAVVGTAPGVYSRLTHVRDGVRSHIWTSTGDFAINAAVTRDGRGVVYAAQQPGGDFRIDRWREGQGTESLLDMGGVGVQRVLTGETDDRFVFTTDPADGQARSYLFDRGDVRELGSFGPDSMGVYALAMSADGSVIVGGLIGADNGEFGQRAWAWRDGVMTEVSVGGLTDLSLRSVSDDGAWMVGASMPADGSVQSFLLHDDGGVVFAADLLAAAGVGLGLDQQAFLLQVSGDGSTVAGMIQGASGGFGGTNTFFTLRIPTPGTVWPVALAGLLCVRRRRG